MKLLHVHNLPRVKRLAPYLHFTIGSHAMHRDIFAFTDVWSLIFEIVM